MKTSELAGAALDWAVGYARCLEVTEGKPILARDLMVKALRNGMASPSTDWSQGGPIIEREKITIVGFDQHDYWNAHQSGHPFIENSPTPLIAAMRCYVASKLGDEVEIPTELLGRV